MAEWGLSTEADAAPRRSGPQLRCSAWPLQPKLGKLSNPGNWYRHAAQIAHLDQLPQVARLPRPDDSPWEMETRAYAKARYRVCTGLELPPAFGLGLQIPSEACPPPEFVEIGRCMMGIGEYATAR